MNLLAIDTATEACSIAIAVADRVVARHVVAGRDQTAVLLPLMHEVLAQAGVGFSQIDALACGVGPGSFAGVRIGVGFVKGLTLVRDLPIVPVTSLASLALGAMRRTGVQRVMSCIDARMGEIYAAVYERDRGGVPRSIIAPRVCKPQDFIGTIDSPWVASGTGWGSYREPLLTTLGNGPTGEEPSALPEAIDAITIARDALAKGETIHAASLEPVYLRNDVALTLEQQAQARRNKSSMNRETS